MKIGRLPALVRTTTFRLALLHASIFILFSASLLAYLYYETAGHMGRQAETDLNSEFQELSAAYRGGIDRLNQAVTERSEARGKFFYLLRKRRVAGSGRRGKARLKQARTQFSGHDARPVLRLQQRILHRDGGHRLALVDGIVPFSKAVVDLRGIHLLAVGLREERHHDCGRIDAPDHLLCNGIMHLLRVEPHG